MGFCFTASVIHHWSMVVHDWGIDCVYKRPPMFTHHIIPSDGEREGLENVGLP
jgi:hypothetical protein